jgi:PAS domain S-box-containing protein
MLTRLKQALASPVFEGDDNKSRLAAQLNTILVIILISIIIYILITLVVDAALTDRLVLALPIFPLVIGDLILIRSGRVQLASATLITGVWLVLAFAAAASGGVRTSAFSGFIVVVLTAGILLNRRAVYGFTVASILAGLGMVYLEGKGLLPPPTLFSSSTSVWLAQAVFFVVAAALLSVATENIRHSLERAQQELNERRRAEEALRESEHRYRLLFDSNPLPMWVYDTETLQFMAVNDAATEHYGYSREEFLAMTIKDIRPPEELANLELNLSMPRHSQETSSTWKHHKKDGTLMDVEIISHDIFFNNRSDRLVLANDITERKRLEEDHLARETAERASQAKSEFLSRMSHELRTPLNAILGFAQLLEMDELNADQTHSLEQILKSGRYLLDLINEVLDIARIESGDMAISPEPVQLGEALKSAAELIRPLADKRAISMQISVPSSQDVFVTADRQRLKQVLLNLLSNAVKYNREGGQIQVTASLLMDGFLHLAVRDTGEGIPPEKMDRLFLAFERLEMDLTIVEGTGLGLALSKGLVEAMGGRIGARSVVGEGSTFWLDLRLTTQQEEAIVMSEVDDYKKGAPSLKEGLVLYVEDNLSNIQLVEKILARLPKVKLITAMQGRLAMDLARQHKPTLILLDLHLPDVHGGDVLQWLRAEPETRDIPVVVMSADATPGQIEHMLAAGARAYLTKPIDVKEFLKVVGEMLAS